jgi:hypothetical protein
VPGESLERLPQRGFQGHASGEIPVVEGDVPGPALVKLPKVEGEEGLEDLSLEVLRDVPPEGLLKLAGLKQRHDLGQGRVGLVAGQAWVAPIGGLGNRLGPQVQEDALAQMHLAVVPDLPAARLVNLSRGKRG